MILAEGTFAGLAGQEIELFRTLLRDAEGEAVEIGCMDGFSTAHLLECTRYRFTSIDPFVPDSMAEHLIGSVDRFKKNIEPWKDRHTLILDYSHQVVVHWSRMLDFLFIDGDHTHLSVQRDYDQWTPYLKAGGILAMHDSRMGRPDGAPFDLGPSQVARDNVYGKPERWEIVGEAFSLTMARKK